MKNGLFFYLRNTVILFLITVNFLFATAQYEYNIIKLKYISSSFPTQKNSVNANSFLVGAGYAGGREKGSNTYYYLSVMWDLGGDKNSPYVDQFGRANPVIRAGYNIGLFQGRNRRGNDEIIAGKKNYNL